MVFFVCMINRIKKVSLICMITGVPQGFLGFSENWSTRRFPWFV